MSKICGYSCKHNKSGVCQISVCDKKTIMSDKTEVQTLRLDELDYTIVPNSDIKPLLDKLQQENKKLNGTIQTYDILLKANVEENKRLKEQLLVAQTNEETFRLEMEDITLILGLDEDTIFDDVKVYARNLKDNWNKLKEYIMNDINNRNGSKVVEFEDGRKVSETISPNYILMENKSRTMREVLDTMQEIERRNINDCR